MTSRFALVVVLLALAVPPPGVAADGAGPGSVTIPDFPAMIPLLHEAMGDRLRGDRSIEPRRGFAAAGVRDDVLLLVTLNDGERRVQWCIELADGVLTPADTARRSGPETVMYSMTGREIRFAETRHALDVSIVGPCESGVACPAERIPHTAVHVVVNDDLLRIGFSHTAAFMERVGRARREGRIKDDQMYTISPHRPPAAAAEVADVFAREVGFDDEDERNFAASVPQLQEFLRVISMTPGLAEILSEIVRRPSVWSVIKSGGQLQSEFLFHARDVVPLSGGRFGLATLDVVHRLPFSLFVNKTEAVRCTMFATAPVSPLRPVAGILALVADSPAGKDRRMVIQVIRARRAVVAVEAGPQRQSP